MGPRRARRLVLLQATERHFFEAFCRAVGREDLLEDGSGAEGRRPREGRHGAAPRARGGDTDDVLHRVLGYDERRIAALRSRGVIG
ncbi:MAG: hypothetical protein ACRDWD_15445 [Acidimicrobiia bacterium]